MRRSRPPVKHREPKEINIIPYFVDRVEFAADLFRFVAPTRMTLESVLIRIDKMENGPFLFNGGIQSGDEK
ncbi:unnamed protein product, partial [marine sediment metagenome]